MEKLLLSTDYHWMNSTIDRCGQITVVDERILEGPLRSIPCLIDSFDEGQLFLIRPIPQ
jgi:hypothetical protein